MKDWTRTPTDWADDPTVHAMADELRIPPAQVIGHLLCVWSKLPEHARDGDLAKVTAGLLEQWARWRGKRGAFARAMEVHVLDAQRQWPLWWEMNGAVLREKDSDKTRAAERRRLIAEAKAKQLDAFAESTAAAIAASPPDSPADAPTDGPPLRTNGRSTTTGGARARNGHGQPSRFPVAPPTFAPGHDNLPPQPAWCRHCGDGVPAHLVGGKRGDRVHAETCPLAPTPSLEVPA